MGNKAGSGAGRRPAAVTLREVAELAGVSPSTVSATLNNAPRAKHYAAATRARILAAAKELGYVANPLAKTLKRSRSGLLGVVVLGQYGIYYAQLLQAAEEAAEKLGYEIVTADMRYDPNRLVQCFGLLQAWSVEGILLLAGGAALTPASLARLEQVRIPVLAGGVQLAEAPFDCITFNNRKAGRLLARHLLDFSHRRIGVLAAKATNHQSEERLAGIAETLKEAGQPLPDTRIIRATDADVGFSAGYRYMGDLLAQAPEITAVLCHSDVMAIGALKRLREAGRHAPQAVSITGFDDLCLTMRAADQDRLGAYLSPALTTIRTPQHEMGQQAITLLVDSIRHPESQRARKRVEFSPELVVRESTGPAPEDSAHA